MRLKHRALKCLPEPSTCQMSPRLYFSTRPPGVCFLLPSGDAGDGRTQRCLFSRPVKATDDNCQHISHPLLPGWTLPPTRQAEIQQSQESSVRTGRGGRDGLPATLIPWFSPILTEGKSLIKLLQYYIGEFKIKFHFYNVKWALI